MINFTYLICHKLTSVTPDCIVALPSGPHHPTLENNALRRVSDGIF